MFERATEAVERLDRGDAGIEQQRTAKSLRRLNLQQEVELRRVAADGIEVGHVAALYRGQRAIRPRQCQRIAITTRRKDGLDRAVT